MTDQKHRDGGPRQPDSRQRGLGTDRGFKGKTQEEVSALCNETDEPRSLPKQQDICKHLISPLQEDQIDERERELRQRETEDACCAESLSESGNHDRGSKGDDAHTDAPSEAGNTELKATPEGSRKGPEHVEATSVKPADNVEQAPVGRRGVVEELASNDDATDEPRKPGARSSPEWKVLEPTDPRDPVEHEECEHRRLKRDAGKWNVLAASTRGKSHAHEGKWRDDAYAFEEVDDWAVIAVSDGAGSAKISRIGARLACSTAVERLAALLKDLPPPREEGVRLDESCEMLRLRSFMVGSAYQARKEIFAEAARRQCQPSDMNTTFLLMVHTRLGEKELITALQVGDGAIGILTGDGECTVLGVADHGEHGGQTRFLTTPYIELEFENRVRFTVKNDVRCIAVVSDGVADDFFPENNRLIELFTAPQITEFKTRDGETVEGVMRQVVKNPQDGQALLDWIKYEKWQSFDDRTLVLEYRSDLW